MAPVAGSMVALAGAVKSAKDNVWRGTSESDAVGVNVKASFSLMVTFAIGRRVGGVLLLATVEVLAWGDAGGSSRLPSAPVAML